MTLLNWASAVAVASNVEQSDLIEAGMLRSRALSRPQISKATVARSKHRMKRKSKHSQNVANSEPLTPAVYQTTVIPDHVMYRHVICKSTLPCARQHPSYGDCLEVKREYYQNSSELDCVTQCSQSAAHLYEQFVTGPTDWVCHIGTLTLCVEAVA